VRPIGGCPNRLAKARVIPSDPAIRAGFEIVAWSFAPLHQTDKCLGAFPYPCPETEGKPAQPEGAEVLAARLLYDLIEARFGVRKSGKVRPRGGGERLIMCGGEGAFNDLVP